MSIDLADYDQLAKKAIRSFWKTRTQAKQTQKDSGKSDQGERANVTSGKNLDEFLKLIEAIVKANGLKNADIHLERRTLTLPGYFRPTKLWDMLILNNGRLVAVIELKSHVGPSFGNNCNNRAEEAIGSANDLWTAYREGAFGKQPKPFLGWLMLVEDCEKSRCPVNSKEPHFPVFQEFQTASYAERYDLLCQKLVQENLYTAATTILSPRSAKTTGKYSELSELTGLKNFLITLAGHISAEAAR
ncbi:PaeR7I family type II restriction endonuclease [Pontiella sp.]|uniref:PaeR7I family type II restriction endonuclease n=1 Tax=Pontiella sp. TaxID=2837462 RepID=UPI003569DDA8